MVGGSYFVSVQAHGQAGDAGWALADKWMDACLVLCGSRACSDDGCSKRWLATDACIVDEAGEAGIPKKKLWWERHIQLACAVQAYLMLL